MPKQVTTQSTVSLNVESKRIFTFNEIMELLQKKNSNEIPEGRKKHLISVFNALFSKSHNHKLNEIKLSVDKPLTKENIQNILDVLSEYYIQLSDINNKPEVYLNIDKQGKCELCGHHTKYLYGLRQKGSMNVRDICSGCIKWYKFKIFRGDSREIIEPRYIPQSIIEMESVMDSLSKEADIEIFINALINDLELLDKHDNIPLIEYGGIQYKPIKAFRLYLTSILYLVKSKNETDHLNYERAYNEALDWYKELYKWSRSVDMLICPNDDNFMIFVPGIKFNFERQISNFGYVEYILNYMCTHKIKNKLQTYSKLLKFRESIIIPYDFLKTFSFWMRGKAGYGEHTKLKDWEALMLSIEVFEDEEDYKKFFIKHINKVKTRLSPKTFYKYFYESDFEDTYKNSDSNEPSVIHFKNIITGIRVAKAEFENSVKASEELAAKKRKNANGMRRKFK